MCEYCGCQEIPAIGELTREHDLAVDLISEVRTAYAAADVPRMAELARRIRKLQKEMKQAAERLDFEAAANLRDQIRELQNQELTLRESDLGRGVPG